MKNLSSFWQNNHFFPQTSVTSNLRDRPTLFFETSNLNLHPTFVIGFDWSRQRNSNCNVNWQHYSVSAFLRSRLQIAFNLFFKAMVQQQHTFERSHRESKRLWKIYSQQSATQTGNWVICNLAIIWRPTTRKSVCECVQTTCNVKVKRVRHLTISRS
jgi:hypothetical protein